MESINESSKLVAKALESLKLELWEPKDLPADWCHTKNIEEVIAVLQKALETLTSKM